MIQQTINPTVTSHVIIKVQQIEQFTFIKFHILSLFNLHLHIGVSDGLLSFMIKSQAVLDSLVEGKLWFVCDVDVLFAFDSEDLVIVVDFSVHDPVS